MDFFNLAIWSSDFEWNGGDQLSLEEAVGLRDSAETEVRLPIP